MQLHARGRLVVLDPPLLDAGAVVPGCDDPPASAAAASGSKVRCTWSQATGMVGETSYSHSQRTKYSTGPLKA